MAALSFSGAAIVERKIAGVEVAAGLVGSALEALPVVEIVPKGGRLRLRRPLHGRRDRVLRARATPGEAPDAAAAGWRPWAAEALQLRDVTRVDVIVDADGRPWVLEVNVAPGMTETSLLPMGAQAAGMTLADLCDRVPTVGRANAGSERMVSHSRGRAQGPSR